MNTKFICPKCNRTLEVDLSSSRYLFRVWYINNKFFEIAIYSIHCNKCGEELLFKSPTEVRPPRGLLSLFSPFELKDGVKAFLDSHSDSILDINYYDFVKEYRNLEENNEK